MINKENTSIQIKQSTKESLKKLGSKGDTYDTIVLMLINYKLKIVDKR